jgi:hypothetical protein
VRRCAECYKTHTKIVSLNFRSFCGNEKIVKTTKIEKKIRESEKEINLY